MSDDQHEAVMKRSIIYCQAR